MKFKRSAAVKSNKPKTIRVAPIPGEPLRYWVQSRSHPQKPHVVDLSEHGGRGKCSCIGWDTTRWPMIRDGCAVGAPGSCCTHVLAARTHWLNHSLEDASAALHPKQP